MPRRRAYSFIICAKAASVPPAFSASAMLASFPDCTIMPLMRMSTGICVPTCTKLRERLEDHVRGHQLGEARRLRALVGVTLGQHAAAEVIDQQIGARVELGGFGYRGRGPRGQGRGGERQRDPGGRDGEQ